MPCLYRKNGNAIVVVVLRDEKSMIPYGIANTVRSIIVYKCSCGVRVHAAMYSTGAVRRLVHISMRKACRLVRGNDRCGECKRVQEWILSSVIFSAPSCEAASYMNPDIHTKSVTLLALPSDFVGIEGLTKG